MTPDAPIRIVLADDHPIVMDGLQALFSLEPDVFQVVGRAVDGPRALDLIGTVKPDVAILDVRMPQLGGIEVLRRIREDGSPTRVILLAATIEDEQAVEAVRIGVDGILLKELAPQLMLECVRRVAAGERWLETHSANRVIERLMRTETGAREASAILTPRELEMVRLAAAGMRNKEISRRLQIREGTVKIHLHNVYEKLGVRNRVQLVLYAQFRGII